MLSIQSSHHLLKKIRSQLANIFTIMNVSCGSIACIFIINGQLSFAILFIILAALLDFLDGMLARKLQIQSAFGKQLDSMSDIISFGIAPALLLYQGILYEFGVLGMLAAIIYTCCGAIRLARYHLSDQDEYFIGLPITASGLLSALSMLMILHIPPVFYLSFTIILAFMMVSTMKVKKIR
ncbi:CDP-diacylglycerol--serine O-phosphatidyltransferase [Bacillus mesophilum]|uniref:CDP-diacylglycerol--serine O-phosphatidyltransferase n=1 Tax=Bacillus mesophilum TaxID=1071718 RepID=A0A7V7RNC6_9BACI|nr:CDP-diacylglycerol--serine O-phosphatidyltransferase [Bacillus mesophilum]KAB2333948.1 CDP-diacylglycerol--serine O-phosphatidyltransferase [Bacillus mesophilum]